MRGGKNFFAFTIHKNESVALAPNPFGVSATDTHGHGISFFPFHCFNQGVNVMNIKCTRINIKNIIAEVNAGKSVFYDIRFPEPIACAAWLIKYYSIIIIECPPNSITLGLYSLTLSAPKRCAVTVCSCCQGRNFSSA